MTEERKLVTILFADIVGSTGITRARDPELVRSNLRRTFDELRPILETHGGTVEKFIGDEVMAVFGVPTAHDDDADRALRAAFAIRERVRELARESDAIPLELRIGIDTGETVAGSGEGGQFLVTGEPVIAAARIRGNAEPGEIAVGALTHRLTRSGISFGQSRTFEAKGIGPLELWPAVALRTDVPTAQRGIGGLRASLIGRDRELGLLRGAFDRVATERAPSLVTVFGAAGVGKSRLISEFTGGLADDQVRIGRCLPYGEGITFYPLQQVLRTDAGVDVGASRAEAIAALRGAVDDSFSAAAAEVDAVARRLLVVLGLAESREALPDVAAGDLMEELRWGVRRYLERRVSAPLVLVFEDVHWAEPALIDLIEYLAEWSKAPLLLVCLARPDFREVRPTFGATAANAVAITLSALGAEDTRRLIQELLEIDALSEDVRAEVIARAEGNPLYVEEFLRTLIETGRIVQRDARWTATGGISAIEIPPTLQGLITARLDRVAPEVKRLLQSASIVGRLFSTSALAAISGESPRMELLREAARRDLIMEVDERAPGEGRVHRFKHALFREVAYSTIPKADRAAMHDRYGRWLEAAFGDRANEVREIVAHHAEQAYLAGEAVALRSALVLGQRALALLVDVADRARIRGDAHAAWIWYVRASRIANGIPADARVRAHARGFAVLGGRDFSAEGRWGPAEDLEDAIALARAAGPSEVLVKLLNARAIQAFNREGTEAAKQITTEMLEVARATADADILTSALTEAGERAYWWGDRAAEKNFLLEAIEAGRRGARSDTLARALGLLARSLQRLHGDYARAAEYYREIAALGVGSWSGGRRASMAAYLRGDFEVAIDHGIEAVRALHERGAQPWMIMVAEWTLADALFEVERDDDRARELLEEASSISDRMSARTYIPESRSRLAIACLRQGDLTAARAHVAAAKAALLPSDDEADRSTATAEARLATAEDDPSAAERILRECITRVAPTAAGFDLALLRMELSKVLVAEGRLDDARAELIRAREFFHDPLTRGWQERIDALLARSEVPTTPQSEFLR